MIDSYYAMFHFDESMDGIGDDTDLPSGFHLVLPLLHTVTLRMKSMAQF